MDQLTLCQNIRINASSQYIGLDFNSACNFQGKTIFANNTGIFTREGTSDNGSEIPCVISFPTCDFNLVAQKRLRRLSIGGIFAGVITLKVTDDGDNTRTYTATCTKDQKTSGLNFAIGRDGKGRYFGFEISTSDPIYLDAVNALLILQAKKIGD